MIFYMSKFAAKINNYSKPSQFFFWKYSKPSHYFSWKYSKPSQFIYSFDTKNIIHLYQLDFP